jgi:hypothetical protein
VTHEPRADAKAAAFSSGSPDGPDPLEDALGFEIGQNPGNVLPGAAKLLCRLRDRNLDLSLLIQLLQAEQEHLELLGGSKLLGKAHQLGKVDLGVACLGHGEP